MPTLVRPGAGRGTMPLGDVGVVGVTGAGGGEMMTGLVDVLVDRRNEPRETRAESTELRKAGTTPTLKKVSKVPNVPAIAAELKRPVPPKPAHITLRRNCDPADPILAIVSGFPRQIRRFRLTHLFMNKASIR